MSWADNLTTFMCRMSGSLVALTFGGPSGPLQGPSMPVMGLLYLYDSETIDDRDLG